MIVAGAVVVGVWSPSPVAVIVTTVVLCVAMLGWGALHLPDNGDHRAVRAAALLAVVVAGAAFGAWRGADAWRDVRPDAIGPWQGWATVRSDPERVFRSWRVELEIEGERYELTEYGFAAGERVARWLPGDVLLARGTRHATDPDRVRWLAPRHVVGTFELDWVADERDGSPLDRFTNRVRGAVRRAAGRLDEPYGALYLGLVIGDDRDQPESMTDRFRVSGLSHLTAVSGQNVAFVLAAAGPLLRSLSPWWRWAATCALIAWFVALTRFEPSILRAGFMAGLAATAFVLGRTHRPVRLVVLAVTALVLLDAMLVWAVGFWLSVGATLGVCTVGPWLAARIGHGPLALPLGITLGAQAGVALPLLLVFGDLPLMSVPANVLAVPVAGAIMLYGLPAGLVAANAPPLAPVLMAPVDVGVRWVDTVAFVASELEPSGAAAVAGWSLLALLVVAVIWRGRRRAALPAHGMMSADERRDLHGGRRVDPARRGVGARRRARAGW